ncbi:MAG: hypothetical protein GF310_13805 [candidate division Zixibacteria bacterium]|nr:hypothetical protein [candidate division Zixibacteria bacterium]
MNSKSQIAAYIVIFLTISFYALGLLMPAYWNWGVFKYSGQMFCLIALALILIVLVIPGLSRMLYDLLNKIFQIIKDIFSSMPPALRTALWIIIPAAILYLLRTESYILGDSHSYVGTIIDRTYISPSSYGYSFFLNNTADLLGIHEVEQAIALMGGISILCGIIFLNFMHAAINVVVENKELRPFLFIAIASSSLIILFTGYTESYPVLAAWLSIYVYYGAKYLKTDGSSVLLILIFLVGTFWHLWFIAFFPSMLYILNRRYKVVSNKILIGITLIYLLGIYLGGQFVRRDYLYISLPPTPQPDTNYTLFSIQHIIDFFNEFLVIGPVMPLMGAALIIYLIGKKKPEALKFLIYASLPAMFMSFIIDPIIGAVRDWDLLSIFGLPIMMAAAMAFSLLQRRRRSLKYILIPVILFNIFHTANFLALNKNPDAAVDRVIEVTLEDKHYRSAYYEGKQLLPFSTILSNIYGKDKAALEFLERRKNPESGDVLARANYYFNQKMFEKAVEQYDKLHGKFYFKPMFRFSYGKSLLMTRQPEKAIELLRDALRDTIFADLYFNLGTAYLLTKKPDSTMKYFELGVRDNPDSLMFMDKCSIILATTKLFGGAIYYQKRIFLANPDSIPARNRLVQLYEQAQMPDSSAFYRDYKPR